MPDFITLKLDTPHGMCEVLRNDEEQDTLTVRSWVDVYQIYYYQ